MAHIVEPLANDRRLQLQGEEFVRPMAFGNNWGRLKIMIRLYIPGFDQFTGTTFALGLSNGTANTFTSPNTTDWLGLHWGGNWPNGTFNLNSGASGFYYSPGNGTQTVLRKVGGAVTVTNYGGGNSHTMGVTGSGYHSYLAFDILRTAPSTYVFNSLVDLNTPQDRRAVWTSIAEAELGISNISAFYGSATVSGGLVYDTLTIYWSRVVPALEIAQLIAVRFH